MKEIIIDSDQKKLFCKSMIEEMIADGSETIVFKKTDKSPTAKQRRLQWLWNTEVANSGIGGNDTKNGVHLTAKWQFCRPILLRDCDIFPILYNHFMKVTELAENRPAMAKEFTNQYISTERLTKHQRAEYLTEFSRFWNSKGVCLTDPGLQGLDPGTFL